MNTGTKSNVARMLLNELSQGTYAHPVEKWPPAPQGRERRAKLVVFVPPFSSGKSSGEHDNHSDQDVGQQNIMVQQTSRRLKKTPARSTSNIDARAIPISVQQISGS